MPRVWVVYVAALALLALAGCQTGARVVVPDLPSDSIFVGRPARPAPKVKLTKAPPPRASGSVPRSWIPGVYERPWRWIVIHHSASDAGSAEIFDRWHRARGWDELGYHFVITNGHGGRDGQVEVGSRWRKQKWGAHCGGTPHNDYNNYGIGVCLVGDFSEKLPSQAQLRSLKKLVTFLARRYAIDPLHVIGHRDAPNAATACPGDALHRYIRTDLRPSLRQMASR